MHESFVSSPPDIFCTCFLKTLFPPSIGVRCSRQCLLHIQATVCTDQCSRWKIQELTTSHVCLKFIEAAHTHTSHCISLSYSQMTSILRNCRFYLQEICIDHEAECWLVLTMHLLQYWAGSKVSFMIQPCPHKFVTWEFGSVWLLLWCASWFGCLTFQWQHWVKLCSTFVMIIAVENQLKCCTSVGMVYCAFHDSFIMFTVV
jgi:hypothetical protein